MRDGVTKQVPMISCFVSIRNPNHNRNYLSQLFPTEAEDVSSCLCVQTASGANPTSCTVGTGGSFPGVKARPGRDADHSPPSSAEVKKEQELYLLSPKYACMERNGTTLHFTYLTDTCVIFLGSWGPLIPSVFSGEPWGSTSKLVSHDWL
jgi:hypothetical protein